MRGNKPAINVMCADAVIYKATYLHPSVMMEAEIPFETMVHFHQNTRRHFAEYSNPTEILNSKKFVDISVSIFGPTTFRSLSWGSFSHLSAVD